jgi:hypothetical protein
MIPMTTEKFNFREVMKQVESWHEYGKIRDNEKYRKEVAGIHVTSRYFNFKRTIKAR